MYRSDFYGDGYDSSEGGSKKKSILMRFFKSTGLKIGVGVFALLVLLFVGLFCTATVGTGKVAVVTQFGNVTGVQGAGFYMKPPWYQYNEIDVTQQQVSAEYSTATKDNQSISQEVTAQIVVDPERAEELYVKFLGNHMDGIVKPVLSDGFKSANAKYSLEETIEKRDQLSADMLKAVQDRLEPYGINVVSVEINNVNLPDEYKAAVERQKVAERDQITAQVKNETAKTEADTNKVIAESLDERNFQKMFIEKWDGELPLYMGGDGSLDMLLPSMSEEPAAEEPQQ